MKKLFLAMIFPMVLVFLFFSGAVQATTVNFQWNASTGAVAGYKLFQGTASGSYNSLKTTTIPGTGTTGSMDLDPTASHYVAAKAYDAEQRESAFSNEILCHPVVATTGSGGTVSPSGTFFSQHGVGVNFNIVANSGYRLTKLLVNGTSVGNLTNNFSMLVQVSSPSSVVAFFESVISFANISSWITYSGTPTQPITTQYDGTLNKDVLSFSGASSATTEVKYKIPLNITDASFKMLSWNFKVTPGADCYFIVDIFTTAGARRIFYRLIEPSALGASTNIYYGIGAAAKTDGLWHSIERDILANLRTAQATNNLLRLDAFWLCVKGVGPTVFFDGLEVTQE